MTHDLKGTLARLLQVDPAKIQPDVPLKELVTESFILIELVISLQEELDIVLMHEEFEPVRTVQDLLDLVESKLQTPAS
ncbi:MAG: phosphopantetheine-binding protein [Candidatus Sericytochromatia bacterium]|nr:phosphopantetheine-binding protein [Candidatus Sericytochromatia bacterium]